MTTVSGGARFPAALCHPERRRAAPESRDLDPPERWRTSFSSQWTMRRYHVYILTNRSGTLYIGVTGNLRARLEQHRAGKGCSFTRRYHLDRLVYAEEFRWVHEALAREKQLKRWRREKKVALIERVNPGWEDWAGWL